MSASRSAYGLTEVMAMYNLWCMYEEEWRVEMPGPSFWQEILAWGSFPTHTAASLYTRFRAMIPIFRDMDK